MNTLSYKTISVNKANANKKWLLIDAEGQAVGRLASKVAKILRGKHKTSYTPHSDCGDYVVIINAEKVNLSGMKWEQKEYIWHTGYPGGQKSLTAETQLLNWIYTTETLSIREIQNFKCTVENHQQYILNYHFEYKTNAMAESINAKIKNATRQNKGTRDIDFFHFRLNLIL